MVTDEDIQHIEAAIECGRLSAAEAGEPRPSVGAVVVKNGKEIGRAYRGETGTGHHAEYALLDIKLRDDDVSGATLYTTLEPCTKRNRGKTPCADRVKARKLSRVVVGMLDPNQDICGRGVRSLREAGIDVDLFPSRFMAMVEDRNRIFTSYQEGLSRGALRIPAHIESILTHRFSCMPCYKRNVLFDISITEGEDESLWFETTFSYHVTNCSAKGIIWPANYGYDPQNIALELRVNGDPIPIESMKKTVARDAETLKGYATLAVDLPLEPDESKAVEFRVKEVFPPLAQLPKRKASSSRTKMPGPAG